jgi:hypothetical protein
MSFMLSVTIKSIVQNDDRLSVAMLSVFMVSVVASFAQGAVYTKLLQNLEWAHITLGWKGFTETNTLAYFALSQVTKKTKCC